MQVQGGLAISQRHTARPEQSWAQWRTVIPMAREAEAEGLPVQGQPQHLSENLAQNKTKRVSRAQPGSGPGYWGGQGRRLT